MTSSADHEHDPGPERLSLEPLDPAIFATLLEQLEAAKNDHSHQLNDLAMRVGAIDEVLEQVLGQTPDGPWSWRAIGAARQRELLDELRDWVDWVIVRYDLRGRTAIRPCWYRHPVAVEELTAVFVAWASVYSASQRQPHDGLATWHSQHWWPCLRRLNELGVFSRCSSAHQDIDPPSPITDAEDYHSYVDELHHTAGEEFDQEALSGVGALEE